MELNINNYYDKVLEKSISIGKPDVIELLFSKYIEVIKIDINKNKLSHYKSDLNTLNIFYNKLVISSSAHIAAKVTIKIYYYTLILLFNNKASLGDSISNYYKPFIFSLLLIIRKSIKIKDYETYNGIMDIVLSTKYLFQDLDYISNGKKDVVGGISIIVVAVQAWIWHLYRLHEIELDELFQLQLAITFTPISPDEIFGMLNSIHDDNFLINWNYFDDTKTDKSQNEWILFALAIYLTRIDSIYLQKLTKDRIDLLISYRDDILRMYTEIKNNAEKWLTVFGNADKIKERESLIKYRNISKIITYYQENNFFYYFKNDLIPLIDKTSDYLRSL